MTERIAIYKVMENRRRAWGRPIRRESVRTQVVNGQEIMTLVYSAKSLDRKRIRDYRVALFLADRCLTDSPIDK